MWSKPTTPLTRATALAAAIAEGRAITAITAAGTLSSTALDAAEALVTTLEDAVASRRPAAPAGGASLTGMLAGVRAQGIWSDDLRDTLVPRIAALEAAGVTLELRPGLVATDPFADPEPALAGRAAGIELHLRPRPLGRAA